MAASSNTLERCKPLLGTFVEVSLSFMDKIDSQQSCDKSLAQFSSILFDEIERIHDLLGFHHVNSELTRLNQHMLVGTVEDYAISSDLAFVLETAKTFYQDSAGLFDVTIAPHLIKSGLLPNHLNINIKKTASFGCFSNVLLSDHKITTTKPLCIDLGGIAKGYAVDSAFTKLPPYVKCTINAGGDMRSNEWRTQLVSIKYAKRTGALKSIEMKDQSVASSGSYYNSEHSAIIQPLLGQEKRIKGSVSVFASQAIIADALTKIVALCSPKQTKELLNKHNAKGIVVGRFGFLKQL